VFLSVITIFFCFFVAPSSPFLCVFADIVTGNFSIMNLWCRLIIAALVIVTFNVIIGIKIYSNEIEERFSLQLTELKNLNLIHASRDSYPQRSTTGQFTSGSDCDERLRAMTLLYRKARKQLGALSCETKGIGPTGGFCLKKEQFDVGGNVMWCSPVAEELRKLFVNQSVYDFGAGLGWYGKVFTRASTPGDPGLAFYQGFDGAENVEEVTNGFIEWMDLTDPQDLPPVDWVLSFEVGEHIPYEMEGVFIQNVHRHNTKGVILSWAEKGQMGHFHVNERDNNYIKTIFASLGYLNDIEEERKLRSMTTLPWFKNTIMVFRRKE
jgi:hypothetical protein